LDVGKHRKIRFDQAQDVIGGPHDVERRAFSQRRLDLSRETGKPARSVYAGTVRLASCLSMGGWIVDLLLAYFSMFPVKAGWPPAIGSRVAPISISPLLGDA
jgi:hypothetical protein